MSILALERLAIEKAHTDDVDGYNEALDKLEKRMSPDSFFAFASSIFGE